MCPRCYRMVHRARSRCDGCGAGLTAKGRAAAVAERQAVLQADCDAFNRRHSVGDTIRVWTGPREGEPIERVTKGPAYILGGHTAVVYVSGGGGCIALSHVESHEQI